MRVEGLQAEHRRPTAARLSPRKAVDFAPAGEAAARSLFLAGPDGYRIEVIRGGGRFG